LWYLNYATADAREITGWLAQHPQVPIEHVRILFNKEESWQNIVHAFPEHVLENPDLSRGDSILVYFVCFGSQIPILCPYDFDTKTENGGVNAGISAPSLHVMLDALAAVNGKNITAVLD
ncbi:hypothetical protein BD413DRAFT_460309, partial [Trametes elegans]